MVKIRRVITPESCPERARLRLDALDRQAFPGEEPTDKPGTYWWLATDGCRDVAFAGLKIVHVANVAFMCRAGVVRAARGQGLHRRLIQVRVDLARKLGLRAAITYTAADNVRSANNLIGAGFRLYRPSRDWGIGGGLYFRLGLQETRRRRSA